VVPATALIVTAAPLLLLPFGEDYACKGTPVLRLLACASLFRVTVMLYVAVARLCPRCPRRPSGALEARGE
jgi:O-antigen/teichoic acid export membrane protein